MPKMRGLLNGQAAPSFGGVSSALGVATRSFLNTIQGGDTLFSQAESQVDRQDEYLTNEAITNALRTGSFDPSLSPRADSGSVYDALAAQQLNNESIETANLEQEGLGYTNKINAHKSTGTTIF